MTTNALRNGSRIFFAESLDTFVQDLNRARPTVFFSVPRLWVKFQQGVHAKMPPAKLKRLMRLPIIGGLVRRKILKGLGLDQCRIAAGGAAPMPPDVLNWYRDLGLDLIEVYGMTENCGVSHATLPGTCRPGTVGLPYKGVESRIDPNTGEIQMRCPALMMGYYKDPEQTAATMSDDGWLKTGDVAMVDPDGYFKEPLEHVAQESATRVTWRKTAACASPAASRTSSRRARANTWPRHPLRTCWLRTPISKPAL